MTIRIIDNKKIDMTEDEYNLYQKIVISYTTTSNKGEHLFMDLFECDGRGIIVFLKPPSKKQTSLEVFLFLMSLMVHQHLRMYQDEVSDMCSQMKTKMVEIEDKLQKLEIK